MSTKTEQVDPIFQQLELMEKTGKIWPDAMMREEGELLLGTVLREKPSIAVELGRKHGYSTLWMLGGLQPDARLVTFSAPIPEDVKIAAANVRATGRASQVSILSGWTYHDLNEALRRAEAVAWQFCFIDACHEADIAWWDTLYCHAGLDVGGILMVHDLWPCAAVNENQNSWNFTVGKLHPPHSTGPAYVAALLKASGMYEVTVHDTPKGMAECRKLRDGALETTPRMVWERMGRPNLGLYPGAPAVPWRT